MYSRTARIRPDRGACLPGPRRRKAMGRRAGLGRAAGVLVACAFAGALLPAATARAESVGYYVYNLTGSRWTIDEIIQYKRGFDPSPPGPPHPEVGQVLMPGVDPDHNHI